MLALGNDNTYTENIYIVFRPKNTVQDQHWSVGIKGGGGGGGVKFKSMRDQSLLLVNHIFNIFIFI